MAGRIHVGVGGWAFPPWRGTFFPAGLPQARELDYASRALTAIEINGTSYRLQKPETFVKWAAATPPGFVFTVKASNYCTNRKVLADGGEAIARFVGQGLVELGDKLGPILWQFPPTKAFDPDDFGAFLRLLPDAHAGVPLRHAIEVRHESFAVPDFVAMARAANVAIVHADSVKYPTISDATADFGYARLLEAQEDILTGYPAEALDRWYDTARSWAAEPRDAFIFFINGAKVRAPAAAMALIDRLKAAGA